MHYRRFHPGTLLLALAVSLIFPATARADEATKAVEISFRPDTIVEAAFFHYDPEIRPELNERYLSKVLPLASEFGMTVLGLFTVSAISHGPDDANFWGFFEWPDLASRHRFETDPRFIELRAVRDELMQAFKIVHLKPRQAFTASFREGHMYEFAGLWLNRTHAHHLEDYWAAVRPFGKANGVRMIDAFEVVGTSERYPFLPEKVVLIDWPNEAVKAQWLASATFQAAGWNRALSIDQLYGVESRFIFPR